MNNVWLTIPSARPAAQVNACMAAWREQGYKIALLRTAPDPLIVPDYLVIAPYQGYTKACNLLIYELREAVPWTEADWFICAGDDTFPDPSKSAQEIAGECRDHFSGTFGCMQPTGDRWGDRNGAYIDRVAGSPWLGREFCRRVNGGNGPLWPDYWHMGGDEELRAVAVKLGVYWERRDLTHYHDHWGRPRAGETMGQMSRMPEFLKEANSPEHWRDYKALFTKRLMTGFPGHELIS